MRGILEPTEDLPNDIKCQDQRRSQVRLEECRYGGCGAAGSPEGRVELGCETEEVEEDAEVRTVDAEGGAVGELGDGMAAEGPGAAEADVGYADRAVYLDV